VPGPIKLLPDYLRLLRLRHSIGQARVINSTEGFVTDRVGLHLGCQQGKVVYVVDVVPDDHKIQGDSGTCHSPPGLFLTYVTEHIPQVMKEPVMDPRMRIHVYLRSPRHGGHSQLIDAYPDQLIRHVPIDECAVCFHQAMTFHLLEEREQIHGLGVNERFPVPGKLKVPGIHARKLPSDESEPFHVDVHLLKFPQARLVGNGLSHSLGNSQLLKQGPVEIRRVVVTVNAAHIAAIGQTEDRPQRSAIRSLPVDDPHEHAGMVE
jgi:hypothetical protein